MMTPKKKTFKRVMIVALLLLFLFVSYLALLGFFSVKALQKVNQQDWEAAAKYGRWLVAFTNWIEPISDKNEDSWLMPVAGLRYGGEMLAGLGRFLETGRIIFQASLENQPERLRSRWPAFQESGLRLLSQLDQFQSLVQQMKLSSLMRLVGQEENWCQAEILMEAIEEKSEAFRKGLELLPELIGIYEEEEKIYTVLFQNDRELRPTGGFIGSYGQFKFQKGSLVDYFVQDIYVPDGAIIGHVSPPEPIQEAFQQGQWRLPNSNWDPDFPTAAETIAWFFDKAGVDVGEGIIAFNFEILSDLLAVLGEVEVLDYGFSVSSDNLYSLIQTEVEREFFPGSTQKKDFLGSLTKALLLQSQEMSDNQLFAAAALAYRQAQKRNIQFYFKEAALQEWSREMGWSGELGGKRLADEFKDYLLIVDANLGANKANCCVDREVIQVIQPKEDFFEIHLQIDYLNQSPSGDPCPPEHWGGDYRNYLRLLLPEAAIVESVIIDDEPLSPESVRTKARLTQKLQEVGFFVNVPHLQRRRVEIDYYLPREREQEGYRLFIQKQSGISYWHLLEYYGREGKQEIKLWVDRDQEVRF